MLRESATQSTPMLYEVEFKRPRSKAIRIGLPRAGPVRTKTVSTTQKMSDSPTKKGQFFGVLEQKNKIK
jgi:hypothetical protein